MFYVQNSSRIVNRFEASEKKNEKKKTHKNRLAEKKHTTEQIIVTVWDNGYYAYTMTKTCVLGSQNKQLQ